MVHNVPSIADGGAILIGGSIREFFIWVEKQGYTLLKLEKDELQINNAT